MKGISIDIGVHNFGLYIEEFNPDDFKNLKSPLNSRYDKNGESTQIFKKEVVDVVYKSGKKILIDLVDLSEYKGVDFRISTFITLSNFLQSRSSYFDDCHFVIIEQQLKTNPMAQRLEQHCVSWFTFNYSDTKDIIIFPSKNKTRVIGAPKKVVKGDKLIKMTKPQRKKWSCDEALKLLSMRDDLVTMKYIFSDHKSKSDDLSDIIIQFQAFKIKCFIDKKIK